MTNFLFTQIKRQESFLPILFKRQWIILSFLLFYSVQFHAVGWTPTDCGLVYDLQPGDQIMLSVMLDKDGDGTPEEYFVSHYDGYTGGPFNYSRGNFLKLIAQASDATEPSPATIWNIDTALVRVFEKNGTITDYSLGGICYTMWSQSGYTLKAEGNGWEYLGGLSGNLNEKNLCDVVFVTPSANPMLTSADPNNTLGRGTLFNGQSGTGFNGMVYHEVYMFDKPRDNNPNTYVNWALVSFNRTTGRASINAFANPSKDHAKQRTIFRLYRLNRPFTQSPSSYYFATNVMQTGIKYRQSNTLTDSISNKFIYTMDTKYPMHRVSGTKNHRTSWVWIPEEAHSTFYVGLNDEYKNGGGGTGYLNDNEAVSQFKAMDNLRVQGLESTSCYPEAGACGYIVVDTTDAEQNMTPIFTPQDIS